MTHHYWNPRVTTPKDAPKDWRSPMDEESDQKARDRRFVRALAVAIQAGHHLPKGQAPFLRLIG